jgi:phosphotransferase system enzyme I (PtsI)
MLDIGGDKLVRGISSKESNPFLGNRSIRYLLSHRDVFRTQLRAILRASAFGHVSIMYPMVSCVDELREASVILSDVKSDLASEGVPYDRDIHVGAMIEVPSAALIADELARHVQFFSIGTNDLVQYTMAADRGNESVAHLYQPTNPAVLKLVRMTIEAAKRAGITVGVCGESASDPIVGVLWAAMGVDHLSMSSTYIPLISKILARLSREDLEEYARVPDNVPPVSTAQEIFDACHSWLAAKIPNLEDILI